MKKPQTWSYAPYRPFFENVGDIYVCRIVPDADRISFDFLDTGASEYSVYYRIRGSERSFILSGTVKSEGKRDISYIITGLTDGTEYEFYVSAGEKKSRVRLARCGHFDCESVINYLHPDDEAYAFSGRYLCSPSIVRHPDGHLLASMDVFAGNHPQNLTLIYRSDDNGRTWHYACELFPCFWGKMFIHKGELYMLGCSTEYADLLIGKSTDGGCSFSEPTILFRGCNGKNKSTGIHKNPEPVIEYGGRIWNTAEWGSWGKLYHAVMAFSAPVDADLMDSQSWEFTEPVKYNENWDGVPDGFSFGNIEGCPVVGRDGRLYSMMRYDMTKLRPNYGLALLYEINADDPAAPMKFKKAVNFPANHSKFEIVWDETSGFYYSLATRIIDAAHSTSRNLLSLMKSPDLENWSVVSDVLDYLHADPKYVGFQYVDFFIEGNDILFQCRTSINGAHNFHDANYETFHIIKNFREL